MLKKSILLTVLVLFSQLVFSQVPPPRHLNVKVYMNKKIISANDEDLILTAYSWNKWNNKNKNRITPNDIKGENGIEVIVDYSEGVTLDMRINGEIMVIHSYGNIDSIQFAEGEYFFNYAENYLFSIHLGKNQKWKNFDLDKFKDEKHSSPTFILEKSKYNMDDKVKGCFNYAEKIESVHGGKNWARNACVDVYERQVMGDTINEPKWISDILNHKDKTTQVRIYPFLKTKFIKHEFINGDKFYNHRFSITEDNGKTWKELMFLKNEWYVHLVYFPIEERIGIDISNSGILLLSDYDFTGWQYYTQNLEDAYDFYDRDYNLKDGKIGLVLEPANWYDNYFGNFVFSE